MTVIIIIRLMLCFTDYVPSLSDPAGREKIKIKVSYEMICITKITMIAKYLKHTPSVHFLATHCHASVPNNSSSIFINI